MRGALEKPKSKKSLMSVDKAEVVCQDRCKWKTVHPVDFAYSCEKRLKCVNKKKKLNVDKN